MRNGGLCCIKLEVLLLCVNVLYCERSGRKLARYAVSGTQPLYAFP